MKLGYALLPILLISLLLSGCATIGGSSSRPAEDAFIRDWLMCGPLQATEAREGEDLVVTGHKTDFLAALVGEANAQPFEGQTFGYMGKTYEWKRVTTKTDSIDLHNVFSGESQVVNAGAYAYTTITSKHTKTTFLGIGSDDTVKVYVNGRLVHDRIVRRGVSKDEDLVPINLEPGVNHLILKVMSGNGGWGFVCRTMKRDTVARIIEKTVHEADPEYDSVFTGSMFPAFGLDLKRATAATIGPLTIIPTFYDADYNEVKNADKPGRYGAVVEYTTRAGTSFKKYCTLYKTAERLNLPDWEWDLASKKEVTGLGIDPKVLKKQSETVEEFAKAGLSYGMYKHRDTAVVLAGLSEMTADAPRTVQRTSVWARNARWWLGLKKKRGEFKFDAMVQLPDGYEENPNQKWPLLLFLHGAGERGDDINQVGRWGPPKLAKAGRKFPFIIVAPQCPEHGWWRGPELKAYIDNMLTEYRVDLNRVYCTGLSMGGYGTWSLALESPDLFAAIAPICGGGDPEDAKRLKDLPIWVFHGVKDKAVPFDSSKQMVDALKKVGAPVAFTAYPEAGHNSWSAAYDNDKLYEWFLANERGKPAVKVDKKFIDPTYAPYGVRTVEQKNKLIAIRNTYKEITELDKLYTDKTHKNGLPYHIYAPEKLKPGKTYPMVVFLHGYSDLTIDTHKGFPKGVWSLPFVQKKHPHILFVPRYRSFDDMWLQENYREMVTEALGDITFDFNEDEHTPNIDTNRIYLTGFSQGGMGTWSYVTHFPNMFAAAAPLSGFYLGPQTVEQAERIKHMPLWIFNGDGDGGVSGSRRSYTVLKEAGAKDVTYHEYPQQGHVIDDFAYFTEGFMDWLFSKKR